MAKGRVPVSKEKFEDIMEYDKDNYGNFLMLVDRFCDIGCYIGTGLSFYYTAWGDPFKWILNTMAKYRLLDDPTGEIAASLKGLIDIDQDKLHMALNDLLVNQEYLELADILDKILAKYNTTFNDYFREAINIKEGEARYKVEAAVQEMGRKRLPEQSACYIPYIGAEGHGVYITTNCDDSIEKIFDKFNINYHQYSGADLCRRDIIHADDNKDHENQIFYIHGRIHPKYGSSNSLVMTKSAYNDKYKQGRRAGRSFNIELLKKMTSEKTLLFLGASLEGDPVVNFLKPDQPSNKCKHVAFFKDDNINDENHIRYIGERKEKLKQMQIATIYYRDFSCISIILCQLIREATSGFWRFSEIFSTCQPIEIPENEFIYNIMESPYEYMYEIINDYGNILAALQRYVYRTCSYERVPGWSVCYINSNQFCFPVNSLMSTGAFHPKDYNAPLGNTVYLISDTVERAIAEKTIEEIRNWTVANKEDENGFKDIKVRVLDLRRSRKDAGMEMRTSDSNKDVIMNTNTAFYNYNYSISECIDTTNSGKRYSDINMYDKKDEKDDE